VRPLSVQSSDIESSVKALVPSETLEKCQLGDRDAFHALFEAYRERVYGIAWYFVSDENAAKDVTQEVFLKLLLHLKEFRADSSLDRFADTARRARPSVGVFLCTERDRCSCPGCSAKTKTETSSPCGFTLRGRTVLRGNCGRDGVLAGNNCLPAKPRSPSPNAQVGISCGVEYYGQADVRPGRENLVDACRNKTSLLVVSSTWEHIRVLRLVTENLRKSQGGTFLAEVRTLGQSKRTVAFEEARCGTGI
jgi:hypothetical protein